MNGEIVRQEVRVGCKVCLCVVGVRCEWRSGSEKGREAFSKHPLGVTLVTVFQFFKSFSNQPLYFGFVSSDGTGGKNSQ